MSYVINCWFRFLGCSFSGWSCFGSLLASGLTKPIIKQSLIISSPSYTNNLLPASPNLYLPNWTNTCKSLIWIYSNIIKNLFCITFYQILPQVPHIQIFLELSNAVRLKARFCIFQELAKHVGVSRGEAGGELWLWKFRVHRRKGEYLQF